MCRFSLQMVVACQVVAKKLVSCRIVAKNGVLRVALSPKIVVACLVAKHAFAAPNFG